jgi:hypothetical protein
MIKCYFYNANLNWIWILIVQILTGLQKYQTHQHGILLRFHKFLRIISSASSAPFALLHIWHFRLSPWAKWPTPSPQPSSSASFPFHAGFSAIGTSSRVPISGIAEQPSDGGGDGGVDEFRCGTGKTTEFGCRHGTG